MEKKLHLASAVSQNGGYSRPNMSSHGLASAKIGQILPIWVYPCVPGDKVSVRHNQFARFQPLNVPSYVDLTYRTCTVFVPYHQVMDGAESFFGDQQKFKGLNAPLPEIQSSVFINFFKDSVISTTTGASASSFDFKSGTTYYKFTALGRYAAKVLRLLGYGWFKGDSSSGHDLAFPAISNALPLLSFAHAYNCYLSYSARYNFSALSQLLETLKRVSTSTNYLSLANLKTILSSILLTYEESFFSSLWAYPYGSLNQNNTYYQSVLTGGNSKLASVGESDGPQYSSGVGVESVPIEGGDTLSAEQIRLLMRFDDYFRRNNYSGSKDIQQIYSRFGVKIADYRTRYPYFIGESAQNVRIGDVTSTSDTDNAPVGAYAGKAISDGSESFSFTADDYGILITFAWFAPRPTYFTGVDPEVLRRWPFDFYTPELDQGFAAAVPMELLNVDYYNNIGKTCGYAPLYSDYLYPRDYIVGDFNRYAGFEAWHFGRLANSLGANSAQSDSLIYMPCTGTEYERIFNVDSDIIDVDTIYMDIRNEVHATRPMRDRSAKAMLGDGSIDLPNMGSQIN